MVVQTFAYGRSERLLHPGTEQVWTMDALTTPANHLKTFSWTLGIFFLNFQDFSRTGGSAMELQHLYKHDLLYCNDRYRVATPSR